MALKKLSAHLVSHSTWVRRLDLKLKKNSN